MIIIINYTVLKFAIISHLMVRSGAHLQFITQFCRPVSTIALFRQVLNGSKLSLSRQLDFSSVHIKMVKTKYIVFINVRRNKSINITKYMSSIAWKYPLDILHLLTYFKVFNEAGMGPSFIYLLDFHLKSLDSEKHFSLRLLRILRGEMWISSLIYGLHLMLSRGTLGSNDTSSTRAWNETSRSLRKRPLLGTRAFSWLKWASATFTLKKLCRKNVKPW